MPFLFSPDPIARFRRRVAPVAAVAVLAAACGAGAASDPAAPGPQPSIAINPDRDEPTVDMAAADDPSPEPVAVDDMAEPGESLRIARERCLAAPPYFEAAFDARPLEDDDEPELSEEELEQTYAPEFPTVDGVAAPDDRPSFEPMGVYDPSTATWEQLDHLMAFCIEQDIVTGAELYGEDADSEDDWCEELASFPLEEVREFAAEEGADVVRQEFAECGLPNPLDS